MEIVCDNCKTEYDFDESRISEAGIAVKCSTCGNVFKVLRRTLLMTEPLKAIGGAGQRARDWMIRKEDGRVLAFRELTTLQKWIAERRVTRFDEISRSGDRWKQLGQIPELAAFFSIADEDPSGPEEVTVPSATALKPHVVSKEGTVELSVSDMEQLEAPTEPRGRALEPAPAVGLHVMPTPARDASHPDDVQGGVAATLTGLPRAADSGVQGFPDQAGPRTQPTPSAAVVAAASVAHPEADGHTGQSQDGQAATAGLAEDEAQFSDLGELPDDVASEPSFDMSIGETPGDDRAGPMLGGAEPAAERYTARYRGEPSQDVSLEMALVRRGGGKLAGIVIAAVVVAAFAGAVIYLLQARPPWFANLIGGLGGLVDIEDTAALEKLVTRGWALVELDTEEDFRAALEKFEEAGGDDEDDGYPPALAAAAETYAIWGGYLLDDAELIRRIAEEAAAKVAPPEPEPPPGEDPKKKKVRKGKTAAPETAVPATAAPPPINPAIANGLEADGLEKLKEARRLTKAALALDGEVVAGLRAAARIHRLEGELDKMKDRADEVLDRSEDDVETLVILGASYLGDVEGATKGEELLERAIDAEPKHLRAHYYLARLYYDQGKTEKAGKTLDALLKFNPSHTRAARLKRVLGGDLLAIASAADAEAIAAGPPVGDGAGDGSAGPATGSPGDEDVDGGGKDVPPATAAPVVRDTASAVSTTSSPGETGDAVAGPASLERGYKLLEGDKSELAVKIFKKVLESEPGNIKAMIGLGYGYLDTGKPGTAAAMFKRALATEPKNGDAIVAYARSMKNNGEFDEAATWYRKYLELYPTGPLARGAKFQLEKLAPKLTSPEPPPPATAAPFKPPPGLPGSSSATPKPKPDPPKSAAPKPSSPESAPGG